MSARAHVRALLARVLPAGIFLASCSGLPGTDPIPSGPSQAPVPPPAYQDLHWRLAGPLRGGWATTARGVPGRPEEFWFGAADGGVWRTTDAGRTWSPLFQHESVASVGALEIAPGDPSIVYVGTGQVTTRWDIAFGDGVYRSKDGGVTWEHRGLSESEASALIVSGFVEPITKELPLEYAVEMNRLIQLQMEGSVG